MEDTPKKRKGRPAGPPSTTVRMRLVHQYTLTALRRKGEDERAVLARVLAFYINANPEEGRAALRMAEKRLAPLGRD